MKNIHKFLFMILASLAFLPSQAQSPEFALYHLTPTLNNPTMLGSDNKAYIAYSYRSQPVVNDDNLATHLITLGTPIAVGKKNNHFTLGASVFNADQIQFLQNFGANISLSYNLQISNVSFLSFGVQAGYFQRRISLDGESTDNQFQNGFFEDSFGLSEPIDGLRKSYFNADLGLMWYGMKENGEQKFFLGTSLQHINQPEIAFVENAEDNLPIRVTTLGGYQFDLNSRFAIMPNLRWIQETGNNQVNIGTWLQYKAGDSQYPDYLSNLRLGAWYNTNNSMTFSLEFMKTHYVLALAYIIAGDNEIEPSQADGIFEISAGFKIGKKD